MRKNLAVLLFALCTACGGDGESSQTLPPPEPDETAAKPLQSQRFKARAFDYALAMQNFGTDQYNSATPLLASQLDRYTLKLPTVRLPSLEVAGIRDSDRAWFASNPMHDQQLYRLLLDYLHADGKRKFAPIADASLEWFFQNTQSPTTNLYAWGEHLSWDLIKDAPTRQNSNDQIHEYFESFEHGDACQRLALAYCTRFALGLWRHQIHDQQAGLFSRHARYDIHYTSTGEEFPRHAGFYVRTWAEAIRKGALSSSDAAELKAAIEVMVDRFEARRAANGLVPFGTRTTTHLNELNVTGSSVSQAADYHSAGAFLGDTLRSKLNTFARKSDEGILALPHDVRTNGKGFVQFSYLQTASPGDPRPETVASIGAPTSILIFPSADSAASNQWASSSASPTKFSEVDDPLSAPDDEASFISATVTGQGQHFRLPPINFGDQVPTKVSVYFRGNRVQRGFVAGGLRIGETYFESPEQQILYDPWQVRFVEWTSNPATGLPWQASDFDGSAGSVSEFGVIAKQMTEGSVAQITQIAIAIELDSTAYTQLWGAGYGVQNTADIALLMARRFEQTGDTRFRQLALAAADVYLGALPPRDGSVLQPRLHAALIELMIKAWQFTEQPKYLDHGVAIGHDAEEIYLPDDSPLPKVTSHHDWYETITGGDDLMLMFYRLSQALESIGR